jgi:hypothetical protein
MFKSLPKPRRGRGWGDARVRPDVRNALEEIWWHSGTVDGPQGRLAVATYQIDVKIRYGLRRSLDRLS